MLKIAWISTTKCAARTHSSRHTHCNPRRDLLTQLMQLNCNWLQHKRLCELLAAPTCSTVSVCLSGGEKRQLTQSHGRNGFLIGTEILRRTRRRCSGARVCVHASVWWAKWKEMWIWVMSSFLNPHFLFRYLYPDPPTSLSPTSSSSSSSSSHQPTLLRLIPPYLGPFPLIDLY